MILHGHMCAVSVLKHDPARIPTKNIIPKASEKISNTTQWLLHTIVTITIVPTIPKSWFSMIELLTMPVPKAFISIVLNLCDEVYQTSHNQGEVTLSSSSVAPHLPAHLLSWWGAMPRPEPVPRKLHSTNFFESGTWTTSSFSPLLCSRGPP